MRWLYANAAGLVAVAHEDFGLTPVEAQAFGLPAVVLRSGGYLDSAIEGITAVFVDEADAVRGGRAASARCSRARGTRARHPRRRRALLRGVPSPTRCTPSSTRC